MGLQTLIVAGTVVAGHPEFVILDPQFAKESGDRGTAPSYWTAGAASRRRRRIEAAMSLGDDQVPDAQFVTDFGDQAVLLPLATVVALVFAAAGWWRGAVAWTATIGVTLATVLLLKLSFWACGHLLADSIIRSPSGHTAAAAAIYGGLLAVVARLLAGHGRWTFACAFPVALVIGTSRLALGVHNALEVTIGGIVGVCGALVAVSLAGPPPSRIRISRMAALTVFVVMLLHGVRMPAEAAIRTAALDIWPLSGCR
jgi:membrane-associated phospholipid phosphatase